MSMENKVFTLVNNIREQIKDDGYTLFTHIDADGFGAQFMIEQLFGKPKKVFYIKKLNRFTEYLLKHSTDVNIVTDIGSINVLPETYDNKVYIFDHHINNDWNFDDEDFEPFFESSKIARSENIVHVIDETQSATGLLLMINKVMGNQFNEFTESQLLGIDAWDTGHFGNWKLSRGEISRGAIISYGIKNLVLTFESKARLISDICMYPEKYKSFKEICKYFFEELEDDFEEWQSSVKVCHTDTINFDGGEIKFPEKYKFAFTTKPQRAFSLFANDYLMRNIHVDFCINYNSKFGTMEVRSFKNSANCFELSKKMGGGGHLHAAGWQIK